MHIVTVDIITATVSRCHDVLPMKIVLLHILRAQNWILIQINHSLTCIPWNFDEYLYKLFLNVMRRCTELCIKEKKKEIWPSPMTKTPIPTENSKTKGQHTQTPPKTSITQQLRTDLGRSVGVTSNPTGVVKPVYGIPTFPLTAKAV